MQKKEPNIKEIYDDALQKSSIVLEWNARE